MNFIAGKFDCIVIGAGHAGCEAALASARMGKETLVLTISLDSVALLPCNPSIGGTAKGHLVREVDALGGEMGKVIDQTFIQIKMLNTSKGAAVRSLRAQADKYAYQRTMKGVLENTEHLTLKQGQVTELLYEGERVSGVRTALGEVYTTKAVIIATGVYLESEIIIGEKKIASGPAGLFPSNGLSASLQALGLRLNRFKTGTPARVDARTIDFDLLEPQYGDEKIIPFSFSSGEIKREQVLCHLAYTNAKTHDIILSNLHRSPLYSGLIKGTGPRYCPSIEDKLVRFSDKERHQVFIEPEGLNTTERYLQGLSTSLPVDIQKEFLRSIEGLEHVEIMRPAYAIEYDCLKSSDLYPDLALKAAKGIYAAGQINGSSGYEEAAAQGIVAGINAVNYINGEEPLILGRDQAYTGVLIDDLVTAETPEPYRMMTARAEHRLILRQDNADVRLSEIGHRLGLVSDEAYKRVQEKKQVVADIVGELGKTFLPPNEKIKALLQKRNYPEPTQSVNLQGLLKRPAITYEDLKTVHPLPDLPEHMETFIETCVKYEGYIARQQEEIAHVRKLEDKRLPKDIDYNEISSLCLEARQKLSAIRPLTVGQASRISGVSPADITVLLIYLEKEAREHDRHRS